MYQANLFPDVVGKDFGQTAESREAKKRAWSDLTFRDPINEPV